MFVEHIPWIFALKLKLVQINTIKLDLLLSLKAPFLLSSAETPASYFEALFHYYAGCRSGFYLIDCFANQISITIFKTYSFCNHFCQPLQDDWMIGRFQMRSIQLASKEVVRCCLKRLSVC